MSHFLIWVNSEGNAGLLYSPLSQNCGDNGHTISKSRSDRGPASGTWGYLSLGTVASLKPTHIVTGPFPAQWNFPGLCCPSGSHAGITQILPTFHGSHPRAWSHPSPEPRLPTITLFSLPSGYTVTQPADFLSLSFLLSSQDSWFGDSVPRLFRQEARTWQVATQGGTGKAANLGG